VAALNVESGRLGLNRWRFPAGGAYPVPDEAYDTAMDDVDLAGDEVVAAAGAVNWAIGAGGATMGVMGRSPGETIEQWSARATAEYRAAWDAFGGQRRRGRTTTGIVGAGGYPVFDEAYDAALDRLEDADNERGAAAIAVNKERAADTAGRAGGRG
jgi:hypothetical protein